LKSLRRIDKLEDAAGWAAVRAEAARRAAMHGVTAEGLIAAAVHLAEMEAELGPVAARVQLAAEFGLTTHELDQIEAALAAAHASGGQEAAERTIARLYRETPWHPRDGDTLGYEAERRVSGPTTQRRCVATTQRGVPCKSFAAPGSDRCVSHDPTRAESMRQARSRGATNANRLRSIEGRRVRLETPGALKRFVSDLLHDVVSGKLPPAVVNAATYAISIQIKLIESDDLDRRLTALETIAQHGWGSRSL
jgi:hypothetical protein